MRNKKIILKKVKELGFELGCWDNDMEKLSLKELKKVTDNATEDYTDVHVQVRGKHYIVEICTVDGEKDFQILSRAEYEDRYGEIEEWEA